jgi:hypothetical protein
MILYKPDLFLDVIGYFFASWSLEPPISTLTTLLVQLTVLFLVRGCFSCWVGREPNHVLTVFQIAFLICILLNSNDFVIDSFNGILYLFLYLFFFRLFRGIVIIASCIELDVLDDNYDEKVDKIIRNLDVYLWLFRPWDWFLDPALRTKLGLIVIMLVFIISAIINIINRF